MYTDMGILLPFFWGLCTSVSIILRRNIGPSNLLWRLIFNVMSSSAARWGRRKGGGGT